jgi:hypothetical protein
MVLQSAQINVKSFLRQNPKPDTNELLKKVEEAFQIVMNKIDRDPFAEEGHGGWL